MRPVLLLPLLLAACSVPASAPQPDLVTYACADGSTLRVRYGKDGAHVTLPDDSVLILPQQVAGSGFWYATPRHDLRGKGSEVRWTIGRRAPVVCRAR